MRSKGMQQCQHIRQHFLRSMKMTRKSKRVTNAMNQMSFVH